MPVRDHRFQFVARVLAFAVAGGIVVTLLVLDLRSPARLEVPDGAQAGSLSMSACEYKTEDGTVAAECGTLAVPESRDDPDSELIALPVVRIPAKAADPAEPIFRMGGGPGLSNMNFPQAGRFADRHDLVLVGYRGVDGSRRLDCPGVTRTLQSSDDITGPEAQRATTAAFEVCAHQLTQQGIDLTAYSVAQRVDDMEAARSALGYEQINLLSTSAGTRSAQVYSARHPGSLKRSAMLSVNPPGRMVWDPAVTDEQVADYSKLCAADELCSTRTDDLAGLLRRNTADLPDHWGPLRIKEGNVRIAGRYGMHYNGASSWPLTAPTVIDAQVTGGGSFWAMSLLAEMALPPSIVWGEFMSFAMLDAPYAEEYYQAGGDPGSALGGDATDFLWGGPSGYFTVWPDSPDNQQYRTVQTSDVETLLVGGTVDFSTPARFATEELLPSLTNGQQVVVPELGHTTDFWDYDQETDSHILNTFFADGTVDRSQISTRAVDFEPSSLTMGDLARVFLGITVGGLLLATVLAAWMARQVRRKGGFGRRAGIWLRILAPVLLGLGAWFLMLLFIWTVGPTLLLTGLFAVVPAVTVAVGLGTYAAWVRPGAPKRPGVLAALGGAAGGALLGLYAFEGLVAPLAAILGAAAAANLALLVLDAVRRRAVPVASEPLPAAMV